MAEDAVGAERDHHVGPLLGQDAGDPLDQHVARHTVHLPVVVTQPLVPVRLPPQRPPGGLVLAAPDGTKRPSGRREPLADVSGGPVRRQHQDEPELRVAGVQGDGAGDPISVVVRVGEDHDQGP